MDAVRRAVPTTSVAIVFHVVIAIMILTARAPKGEVASIAKTDDLVEVGADHAVAAARESSGGEDTIIPAPGGGAMFVAPRGRVGSVVHDAPRVAAESSAKELPLQPSTEVPTVPTVAIMPPRPVGIGGSNILLPKTPTKTSEIHASPVVDRLVTATIEDATRGAAATNGRAVFVVKAETKEGDCSVVAVDLVDREGTGWDEARRVAYERLRGKKLSVPAGTKVALLSIEVTSGIAVADEAAGRRGENDMPEIVLPELTGGEHRVIASRVVRTTYL